MRMALKISILESHLTQRMLARAAGMPESRLSDIVRGWTIPRPDECAALARSLDWLVEELFESPQSTGTAA